MASLLSGIEPVYISSLRYHPENARKGDIDAIARSLCANGQFSPVVVQRSTNYILAGNHTVKAAVQLGWSTIDVVYVNVDDQAAKKILIAANRTADLSSYDNDLLIELLESLNGDLDGTGYTEIDLDVLRDMGEDVPEDEDDDIAGSGIISYGAVIDCDTLAEQRQLVARLRDDGLDARPLRKE